MTCATYASFHQCMACRQGSEEKAEGREGSPRSGLYLAKVRELPYGEVSTEGYTTDLKLGQEGKKAERAAAQRTCRETGCLKVVKDSEWAELRVGL